MPLDERYAPVKSHCGPNVAYVTVSGKKYLRIRDTAQPENLTGGSLTGRSRLSPPHHDDTSPED